MFGKRCLISAATPEAAGAAILVPDAKAYVVVLAAAPRAVLSTRSKMTQGTVTLPAAVLGIEQSWLVGVKAPSPPGAATQIAEFPKLV